MATLEIATRNDACAAITARVDSGSGPGFLVFRTSASAEVATLTFSATSFGAPSAGVATANAIAPDNSATGGTTDRATIESGDNAVVMTASVGVSAKDIIISSAVIGAGDKVSCSALTITVNAGSL